MNKVKTHLMFQGEAEKAVDLYKSLFKEFRIEKLDRYQAGEGGEEGAFKMANISFCGHELIVFDSPPVHKFSFTPSMSLFVDFETEEEFESTFGKLSEEGLVMMPPDNYGFSQRYTWITDRFGVSWQLNLP